ncbi:MAG: AraC family transcriptional regulator [Lentisphaeria bacterium]|nr:AraC family transcriptional regulator [Lentisphaeria bacterium]
MTKFPDASLSCRNLPRPSPAQTEIYDAPPYEGTFRFPCLPVRSGIQCLSSKSLENFSSVPSSFSGEFSFLYLREGTCLIRSQGQEYQLDKDGAFLTCNEFSCTCHSNSCVLYFFIIQGETALFLGRQLQKQFSPVFHLSVDSQVLKLFESHLEVRRSKKKATLYEESEFCYHFMLTLSQEQGSSQNENSSGNGIPPNLVETVAYMESHLSVPFLNLDKLAQIANLSKYHFIRLFTKYYGISPGKFLLGKRLYHAAQLLEEEQTLSLKEIISQCGFSSETYFCSAFRKTFHRSPGSHRRLMNSTWTD